MTYRIPTLTLLTLALLLCSTAAAAAAFPGKNGRIVFDSFGSGRDDEFEPSYKSLEIRDVKPNGDGERTLISCTQFDEDPDYPEFDRPDEGDCSLRAGRGAEFGDPSYSPDGRRIVFYGAFQIGVMNADGSGRRLYEATTGNPAEPAFSPEGRHVVFTDRGRGKAARSDLYVLDLRTKQVRLLVRRGRQAAWSVRNRIAFVRARRVYTIRPDGTGLRLLIRGAAYPDWSPNGRRIAFVRRGRIQIARPGTGRTRLLRGTASDPSGPVWSPDGKLIGYDADITESIFVIRTDGRRNRLLQEGQTGQGSFVGYSSPDWQPLR